MSQTPQDPRNTDNPQPVGIFKMFADSPGSSIGNRYQLVTLVNKDRFGSMHKAKDLGTKNEVWIRMLMPGVRDRVEATAGLSHAALAKVQDVLQDEKGTRCLVFAPQAGRSLRSLLALKKKLLPSDAVTIAIQVLSGLEAVHCYLGVHANLSTDNLFIDWRGEGEIRVAMIDYWLDAVPSVSDRPYYCSPEQVKESLHIDLRSDIWTTGVILYEMLAGKRPYEATAKHEIVSKILLMDPVSRLVLDHGAEPVLPVLKRALRKPLKDRFGSATEMREALLGLVDELESDQLKTAPNASPFLSTLQPGPAVQANRSFDVPPEALGTGPLFAEPGAVSNTKADEELDDDVLTIKDEDALPIADEDVPAVTEDALTQPHRPVPDARFDVPFDALSTSAGIQEAKAARGPSKQKREGSYFNVPDDALSTWSGLMETPAPVVEVQKNPLPSRIEAKAAPQVDVPLDALSTAPGWTESPLRAQAGAADEPQRPLAGRRSMLDAAAIADRGTLSPRDPEPRSSSGASRPSGAPKTRVPLEMDPEELQRIQSEPTLLDGLDQSANQISTRSPGRRWAVAAVLILAIAALAIAGVLLLPSMMAKNSAQLSMPPRVAYVPVSAERKTAPKDAGVVQAREPSPGEPKLQPAPTLELRSPPEEAAASSSADNSAQPAAGQLATVEKPKKDSAVPTVTITLDGLPKGAVVTVNGENMTLPIALPKSRQKAVIKAEAEGYVPYQEVVIPWRDRVLDFNLKSAAPPKKTKHKRSAR